MATSPPQSKIVTLQSVDTYNFWTVLFVSGGILVLYSLSRIIAIQRRVRDLEARPPVDDIVMRGLIRQQVSEMVTDLEKSLKSKLVPKTIEKSTSEKGPSAKEKSVSTDDSPKVKLVQSKSELMMTEPESPTINTVPIIKSTVVSKELKEVKEVKDVELIQEEVNKLEVAVQESKPKRRVKKVIGLE